MWRLIVGVALLCAASASANEKTVKALQATVAAQAVRLQALEAQLRTGVCATPPKGSKQDRCMPLDVDPEPELLAFRAAERRRMVAKKQEQLTTIFNVSVGAPLTALAVSSALLDNKNVPRLVAVADASGTLYVYDRTGELSVTVPALSETSAATISTIVIGPKEDPFVATGTLGGELDASGAPIPVLTLESYMRARKSLLAVGDASGALRLLHRNGSQRSVVSVGGAVRALERNKEGVFVAVAADGQGVLLYDMSKPAPVPTACSNVGSDVGEGVSPEASVVSVAWDVQLPQLVYAGTDAGEIRIYNSKARHRQLGGKHNNESRMTTVCKLVTVVSGHEPSAVGLAPLKGYLLSAAGSLLAAHNVSGLYARKREEPSAMLGKPLSPATARSTALLAGTRASHVAVGSGAQGQVWLLASKLPFKEESKEGGSFGLGSFDGAGSGPMWLLRNPLVLGVIMMLVFWQTSKMWSKNGAGGPGAPGSGAGLDPDVLRTLEAMRGSGGRGGGGAFGAEFGDFGGGRGGGRGGGGGGRIEEIDSK